MSEGDEVGGVPVVAAVLRRGDRYLVGRRPAHKRHGGLWEFPGGKVDPGEDRAAALRRELAEELALHVGRVGATLWTAPVSEAGFRILFVAAELPTDAEPRALEHDTLAWFTVEELAEAALAPSDAAFVAWLRSRA